MTKENAVVKEYNEIISKFSCEELKEFMTEHTADFATKKAVAFAKFITSALRDYKKLLNDQSYSIYNDITITAALMSFAIPIEKGCWSDVFKARNTYYPLILEKCEECKEAGKRVIGPDIVSAMFDLLESRFGENTPIPRLKPIPNHPTEFFASTFYFFNATYQE